MVRRDAAGIVAVAALGFAAVTGGPPAARAQAPRPAQTPQTPQTPQISGDLARAKQLYDAAEAAMKDDRFDDAIRDYTASYDASRDPALLYKIGRAHERAGRCDVALGYYGRYLREGDPAEPFVATTRERIAACGGDPAALAAGPPPIDATPPAPAVPAPPPPPLAAPPPPAPPPPTGRAIGTPNDHQKVAWVLVGSGLALVTLGGVLAYAASSSENDVRDLYLGFNGQQVTFDDRTRQRYDTLVDEGRRYEHLSWAAFGLAGAAAIGSALLFTLGREPAQLTRVTPVVTTTTAGVAVAF
jgi:tetratricopeptide (TPR) repeat protein